jgi:hypothetical protein
LFLWSVGIEPKYMAQQPKRPPFIKYYGFWTRGNTVIPLFELRQYRQMPKYGFSKGTRFSQSAICKVHVERFKQEHQIGWNHLKISLYTFCNSYFTKELTGDHHPPPPHT